MTRQNQCTYNMIVYLLIGCLLQADRITAAPEVSAQVSADGSAAGGAIAQTGAQLSTLIKETGATATDFYAETTKAAEQAIRAGGRATLALAFLCSKLLNGMSATVASGSGLLASGTGSVDGVLNYVPVVRVVSAGLNNFVSGMASTINEMSQNARQSREKMIQALREQLNDSDSTAAKAGVSVGASGEAGASVSD